MNLGIVVEADTSKLGPQLSAAAGQVNAAGEAAAGAVDKATEATNKQAAATSALGERLKAVKKTYGEQVETIQGLMGKVFAVGAIATTFYKIGEAISLYVIDRLKTANERAEEFRKTISKTDEAAARMQIADKFDEINQRIYETGTVWAQLKDSFLIETFGASLGDNVKDLQDQLKQLSIDAQTTFNRANLKKSLKEQQDAAAEAAKAQKAEADKAIEDQRRAAEEAVRVQENAAKAVADAIAAARLDSMTEEERIVAEAEARIAELIKAFNAQTNEARIASEQATIDAIAAIRGKAEEDVDKKRKDAEAEAARKKEEERQKEEEWWEKLRKHQEEQEQKAKQTRDAWSNAYKAIREESNKAFASDQAASLVQFAQQLRIEGMAASASMNRIVVEGVG